MIEPNGVFRITLVRSVPVFFVLGMALIVFSCSPDVSPFQSNQNDQGIEIKQGEERVLFYQVKPRSLNGRFTRASYIHPLYSLDGNVLTEDFPEDHPHHHGIYSAWHQIILNDSLIGDGWTGKNVWWEVVDTKVVQSKKRLLLRSNVLWKSKLHTDDIEPIVREKLNITVHASRDQFRIVDYDFTLTSLKDGIKIGGSHDEKGYGGFSLRFRLPSDIMFLAQGGKVEPQVTSVDAGPWMNFAGSFDGPGAERSGVVVLSHPSNPGHPQPWILRKEKSMQNPAFPGRTPVALTADSLRFRYRMIVYKGGLEEEAIDKLYRHYSED